MAKYLINKLHSSEGYYSSETLVKPLIAAINNRNIELIKDMLDKGTDPKIKDTSGLSSIDIAKETKNREIIRLINRVVKPLSNVTEDIKDDLRYRSNAIPIKVNEENKLTNESAKKVLGNKDLSELISKYGGKRRKCATKKTRRKKSMYKRKSKKRLSKSK